jgi:hypothetical protein
VRALIALSIAAAVLGLAACGLRVLVTVFTGGNYQGKPYGQPWSSAPLPNEFRGGSWKQNDRASWEEQIKNRQLAQHEHKRIYQ